MSSYWTRRRRILKGVERDKQEIAVLNNALLAAMADAPEVSSIPEKQENAGVSPVIQTPLHRAKSLRKSHHSVIGPWTPLASRVQHDVFSYEDFQRLQNEKQAVMDENQALREENQALRESIAREGTDQTLILQCLGEFGKVLHSMDNKMETMLQRSSANVSDGELSLPGDLLLPLDSQEDLAFLDNSLRQDKELQEQFLRFLALKCGRDLKTTVWRMLQSIFSNHLSINTTWTGVGDKACFRDTFLKTIVQRAIRKNPATQDATDEAVQDNVMRYLKGASDREGGKRRRTADY
ncbi:hypothetical protein UPYG_G00119370 [Umbra pygmaea]|uniref:DUF4806 domain-containing protein n=1 Tax=Umbra pygmaea TaxID=75934 RepID=A0ABD0X5F8_UMBPY